MKIAPTATQFPSPINSLLAARKAAKPNIASVADVSPAAPAVQGGPLNTPTNQVDLKEFFAAWGTANAQFDVTKDGTVDAQDLAVFLGNVGKEPSSVTQQDVLQAWGQSSGPADINGDGTVDAQDLALALGNAKPPSKSEELVAGVQKNWGTNNKDFDLNGDGTIDASDLAIALSGAPIDEPATKSQSDILATKIVDSVFAARDIDQDAALTMDEIPAAAAGLARRVDTNHDGVIGRDELRAQLARQLADVQARRPDADLDSIAKRWLNAFMGKADSRTIAARNAYANAKSMSSMTAVNESA